MKITRSWIRSLGLHGTYHQAGKLNSSFRHRRRHGRGRTVEMLETRALLSFVPAGDAGTVNTYLKGYQGIPIVATRQDQSFTIVWQDNELDGSSTGIYARRYLATGVPEGPQFRVNTDTAGEQQWPFVASNDAGDTVIAWASVPDGTLRFQRFAPDGAKLGENQIVPDSQVAAPGVIVDPDGSFFIAWNSGDNMKFHFQRYDSEGNLAGSLEAPLSEQTWNAGITPGRARRFGNELLIPFQEWRTEFIPDVGEIFRSRGVIRHVPLDGSAVTDTVLLQYDGADQAWIYGVYPNVLPLQDGTLLATWTAGGSNVVRAKRFDSQFQPIGEEFSLSGIDPSTNNYWVRMAQLANGDIVATSVVNLPKKADAAFFRVYGIEGTPRGETMTVAAANADYLSSLEVIPHGDAFTLVWPDPQDRYSVESNVRIQQFKSTTPSVQVALSSAAAQVNENDYGFQLDVVRTGTLEVPTTVRIVTVDDSATVHGHYTPIDQDVVFQPGESQQSIYINVGDNDVSDGPLTFRVVISSVSGDGATIANPSETVVTIIDDESPGGGGDDNPGTISIQKLNYSYSEGNSGVRITLTRSVGSAGAVSVVLKTSNGTAVASRDYKATRKTVWWADGDLLPKTVTIPIVNDKVFEPSELFYVGIGTPTGDVSLGPNLLSSVRVVDNDTPVKPKPKLVRLAKITPKVTRGQLSSLTISFAGTPDPRKISGNAIYLVRAGKDKKVGTKDDVITRFTRYSLDMASVAVKLTAPANVALRQKYYVRIDGRLIKDLKGQSIDADGNGTPGGVRYVPITTSPWIGA